MHSKMEAGAMATLLKKLARIYTEIRVVEKAEAATQRDIARMQKELDRREARVERGWRVFPNS